MSAPAIEPSDWRDLRVRFSPRSAPTGPPTPAAAETAGRRAAVAAVLGRPQRPELLIIRRAQHPEDPWSGHMAFPGGRVDRGDADPLAAARRETREEVGLDLETGAALVGALPHVPVIGGGRRLPLTIHPYVFGLHRPVPFRLNHEVEETLWVPLDYLRDRANRDTFVWEGRGARVHMPCCDFEGRRIWGLTLRMIDDLLLALDK